MINLIAWFGHAPPVLQMGALVLLLLVFSTMIVQCLQLLKPKIVLKAE